MALRAGLGWIGKCALLINKQFGAAFRLTTVLADLDIELSENINKSICGTCDKCVKICPANALSGAEWEMGMDREEYFDVLACFDMTQNFMKDRNISHHICGMCIAACPWTQKYIKNAGN